MVDKLKKTRKKIEMEKGCEPKVVAEEVAIKKNYTQENLAIAIEDLSIEVNNAYFRAPFNRCPSCNKGNNAIMAHFGFGGANKIGNLSGFQAIVGDVIAWSSDTYKGISVVKSKQNGVFELTTSPFHTPRKEPAVVERMIIPEIYRPILAEMAQFLTNGKKIDEKELVKIGNGEYPRVIAEKL